MNSNVIHDASMVSAGVTGASGVMLWFGQNATAIGAIITVLMFILTLIFQVLNYQLNKKYKEHDRRKSD